MTAFCTMKMVHLKFHSSFKEMFGFFRPLQRHRVTFSGIQYCCQVSFKQSRVSGYKASNFPNIARHYLGLQLNTTSFNVHEYFPMKATHCLTAIQNHVEALSNTWARSSYFCEADIPCIDLMKDQKSKPKCRLRHCLNSYRSHSPHTALLNISYKPLNQTLVKLLNKID